MAETNSEFIIDFVPHLPIPIEDPPPEVGEWRSPSSLPNDVDWGEEPSPRASEPSGAAMSEAYGAGSSEGETLSLPGRGHFPAVDPSDAGTVTDGRPSRAGFVSLESSVPLRAEERAAYSGKMLCLRCNFLWTFPYLRVRR